MADIFRAYPANLRPSAADLLSLMSFFDAQGIPENLLRVHERKSNSSNNFHSLPYHGAGFEKHIDRAEVGYLLEATYRPTCLSILIEIFRTVILVAR